MSRTLVLAVDLWAAQPLHFARTEGGWVFASEYKALIGVLTGDIGVDPRVARQLVAIKYLPLHHTLAPCITALGPGEFVRLNAERCEHASYKPLQLEVDAASSEEQCAAELRERILTAAHRLAEGRDALAVGLSSGLDSTLTLAALRKAAPRKRIYTYTASFDRNDPVLRTAAQTAHRFGAVHREIVVEPENLPSLLSQLVWRMEDPVARDEMLVYHLVAQHAARDASLVLYGQMADLLFAETRRVRAARRPAIASTRRRNRAQRSGFLRSLERPPDGALAPHLHRSPAAAVRAAPAGRAASDRCRGRASRRARVLKRSAARSALASAPRAPRFAPGPAPGCA